MLCTWKIVMNECNDAKVPASELIIILSGTVIVYLLLLLSYLGGNFQHGTEIIKRGKFHRSPKTCQGTIIYLCTLKWHQFSNSPGLVLSL